MRETLIGIIVALATLVNTTALKIYWRIVAAVVAAAIAVAVCLLLPGCQGTLNLDGKVYSNRLDILTPIGATTGVVVPAAGPKQPLRDPDEKTPAAPDPNK